MTVDNSLYERHPHAWWDDAGYQQFLLTGPNPARFSYFCSVLQRRRLDPSALRLLDLGSGGGYLAESFAELGAQVTGIDPAGNSVRVAAIHAETRNLSIDYSVGAGERLPFPDASFDLVTCCDVLEHLYHLDQVLAETARVLKPGGLYFYDTINRTPQSWLVMVQIAQEFPLTRIVPRGLHDWSMFLKPQELERHLARVGIRSHQVVGLNSRRHPLFLLGLILQVKLGKITHAEFGRRSQVDAIPGDFAFSYMGYGVREQIAVGR
ncbi:MAG: bifunctional 2-polyprenyl-6-hydroxyphenol methylase/3-demethylubiquinol 3-O-methyltransferase UbiG [Caldilineaceae bacterium]|nr:bifunctional 2-polyprenyl-6-hydroxyphenol methylase/3-demethylubiquinol 3-O-methyltransferase UbiG [Caldilineaceae bacterium]